MFFLIIFVLIVGALLAGLAFPPALRDRSGKRFFIAFGLSFFGVLLPLGVFLLSAFLEPDWKGACPHGWIDCFQLGKLALTPVALWATAALYALDVYQVSDRKQRWVVLGILLGAIVATGCFIFGVISVGGQTDGEAGWLLVPFYVAVWYVIRAAQLIKAAEPGLTACLGAIASSLPFWFFSLLWSRNAYASLPASAPDCFVVTAAARGHETFVGPFMEVTHHGRTQLANRQLLILWQFESFWRTHAPGSHAKFRRIYNRLGPVIAGQIASPWMADLTYLVIKPAELLAGFILNRNAGKDKS